MKHILTIILTIILSVLSLPFVLIASFFLSIFHCIDWFYEMVSESVKGE